MKRYLVQNLEVYIVSYLVDAESPEDAIDRFTEEGEEVGENYMCDLSAYINKSKPYVQEIA